MDTFPGQTSVFSLLLISVFISIYTPTSLSADSKYTNCSRTANCGSINGITYPFYGINRADYCGYPGYEVSCDETGFLKMDMENNTYRITDLNSNTQTLAVARDDYWETLCPSNFRNSTVDFSLFSYHGNLVNLTQFYGCSSGGGTGALPVPVNCNSNTNVNISLFYALDPSNNNPYVQTPTSCQGDVYITVFGSSSQSLQTSITTTNQLQTTIKGGFGLQWTMSDQCKTCTDSGGACGYSGQSFTCYCSDGTQRSDQCTNSSGKSSSVAIGIGVAGGVAIVVVVLLGCWRFVFVRRREKFTKQQNEPPTLPPGKITTPSTAYPSQTIPSYSSSQISDVGTESHYFGLKLFDCAELEAATANFDNSRELGDGGFGTVYYGILKDGREVAVKRLYESSWKRVEQFKNEIDLLAHLRHPHLVTLYGCTSRNSKELLLVYEFVPNGTIADHLHGKKANSGLLTWPVRLNMAIETAEALAYLHASDVIHRDVKSNNILLDKNFRVKVADFGLSRLFPHHVTHVSTSPQGTPGYVDPEYYQCYQLTDKSDVYSFGVVLTELISSLEAVDTNRHKSDVNLASMAMNKIQGYALHELVDPRLGFEQVYSVRQMTTAVAELAFRCLQQQRDMRPTMDEVLQALREIQNQKFGEQTAEVMDIRIDEVGLLRTISPSLSPDFDSPNADKHQVEVLRRTA